MHHWITCIFYFHICIHGSNFGSTMRYKRVKLSRQNIVASRASSSSSFHHRHSFLQWQCVATGKGRLGSRVRLLQLQLLMSPIPTRDRDNVHLFALCKRAIKSFNPLFIWPVWKPCCLYLKAVSNLKKARNRTEHWRRTSTRLSK